MRLAAAVVFGGLLAVPAGAQQPALRQVFELWDLNRDGRVTWDEAWEGIQRRFVEADLNRDGALSGEEWLAARLPGRPARPNQPAPEPQRERDRRMAMFRAIDANRDDRVVLNEIRPVAEAWFRSLDANGDGAITPEELPRPATR
jgi:hypothetical protein